MIQRKHLDAVDMGSFAVIIRIENDRNRYKERRKWAVRITSWVHLSFPVPKESIFILTKCGPWIMVSMDENYEWIGPWGHTPTSTVSRNACMLSWVITDTRWSHVSPQTTKGNGQPMDYITLRTRPQSSHDHHNHRLSNMQHFNAVTSTAKCTNNLKEHTDHHM